MSTIRLNPYGGHVKLIIVYDGSLEDFTDDFIYKYYANTALGLNIQFIEGSSDLNSFLITLALAKS